MARVAQLKSDLTGTKTQSPTLASEHQNAGHSENLSVLGARGRTPLGTEALVLRALFGLASAEGEIGRLAEAG